MSGSLVARATRTNVQLIRLGAGCLSCAGVFFVMRFLLVSGASLWRPTPPLCASRRAGCSHMWRAPETLPVLVPSAAPRQSFPLPGRGWNNGHFRGPTTGAEVTSHIAFGSSWSRARHHSANLPARRLTYHTYGQYNGSMPTKHEILDNAITVLRRGEALTLDAVARGAGLTKPGIVHHFGTKEGLTVSVVDRIVDRWEENLRTRTPKNSSALVRFRAYVDFALTGNFDQSDLALIADLRLRESLCALWAERLDPWFGTTIEGGVGQRASLRAARLLADGAWFNQALGIRTMNDDERDAVRAIALQLVNAGDEK